MRNVRGSPPDLPQESYSCAITRPHGAARERILLTDDNHEALLAEAAGKSKRAIEELAARLSPKASVPDRVSTLRVPRAPSLFGSDVDSDPATSRDTRAVSTAVPVPVTRREERRPVMAPLSENTFKIEFTAPRALRDKLREAQDLLRHRVPHGELAAVFEKALDALIVNLKKERFAVGRRPRTNAAPASSAGSSRNIPDPIKRAVYERAEGRCEFVAENGRRCTATGGLEFDHVDGFARTHVHSVDGIRLACRCHNAHAAEQMYGRVFMDRIRSQRTQAAASARAAAETTALPPVARPGASPQQALF